MTPRRVGPSRRMRRLLALTMLGLALPERPLFAAPPAGQPEAAPVSIETVVPASFPIAVTTIGHIEALQSVLMRAQVTGQLMSIGFSEGQPVQAGQVIARIDPRLPQATVSQDQALVAQDQATLQNAQAVLSRARPLVTKGLVSTQDLEGDHAQVVELRARVQADRAVLARDQVVLGYTTITSPLNGIAGLLAVSPGNVVMPQDPAGLVVITQVEPILALFPIPGSALPDVQQAIRTAGSEGLAVEIRSTSGAKPLGSGRLTAINNQVDQTSGTVMVKATMPNRAHLLWPGEFVDVSLVLDVEEHAISVPLDTVQRDAEGAFVWTLSEDGYAHRTPIETGQSAQTRVLVSSGLKPGDRVVTDGQYGLTDDAPTRVVKSGNQPGKGRPEQGMDDGRLGITP